MAQETCVRTEQCPCCFLLAGKNTEMRMLKFQTSLRSAKFLTREGGKQFKIMRLE